MRTIAEINDKLSCGQAVVWTIEELKAQVVELGVTKVAQMVDVVTIGTFEPMESSGAILNLGHTDPPIQIRQCWLDGVLAYSGFGAVDLYLGATQGVEDSDDGVERGGGHVIADLIAALVHQFFWEEPWGMLPGKGPSIFPSRNVCQTRHPLDQHQP